MKPLTLDEAAAFLRMSKSTLYQNRTIPRYRRPGSRVLLFDQDELEAWLRTGRIEPIPPADLDPTASHALVAAAALDTASGPVYHRNPRYR